MPRKAKQMSDMEIKNLAGDSAVTYPKRYHVGGEGVRGLYIQVTPNAKAGDKDGKSWLFRYTVPTRKHEKQKRRELGLGEYSAVPLKQARKEAIDLGALVRAGMDPKAERERAKAAQLAVEPESLTFEQAATEWLDGKGQTWKNPKEFPRWTNFFKRNIYPQIGHIPLVEVATGDIKLVLKAFWITFSDARKVRNYISNIFDWAIANERAEGLALDPTPTKKQMDAMFTDKVDKKERQHHAALPWEEMPDFFRVVSQHENMAATALQVIMLTACRTQEVRFATWDQFDFKRKVWTIPKETMKAGKPHRVPLCDKLVEILKGIPQLDNNPHVFFGQKEGQPISDMTVLTFLQKRLGRSDLTVHGFRSTFRDWAAEKTEYANEVVENALAHTVRNQAEAAYRRGDMLERRRPLMTDWADYCSPKSKVTD